MDVLLLEPSYIINNYKQIDISKDNQLLSSLIGKNIVCISEYHNGKINIDLWKIKNNDNDFLEIGPFKSSNMYQIDYTVSFRKNYDINMLISNNFNVNKKYYIPSERWKINQLISKQIDDIIFSYIDI